MTLPANPAAPAVAPATPLPAQGLTWPVGGAGLLAVVAIFAIPAVLPGLANLPLEWAWLLSAAAIIVFCGIIGLAINNRPAGLIIDNRNRVSLSKFQATAWSILILSALITSIFARLHFGVADPADVGLTNQLLAVMGISATSMVASPLILSGKAGETPAPGQEASTAAKLGDDMDALASAGKVYARQNPADAQWLDMFRGEEVGNAGSPDLSKVQQFLITIVVLTVYGAAIWASFVPPPTGKSDWLSSLPAFSDTMVWLIGISHAGYLAYKAAPHGASGDALSLAAPTPDEAAG